MVANRGEEEAHMVNAASKRELVEDVGGLRDDHDLMEPPGTRVPGRDE